MALVCSRIFGYPEVSPLRNRIRPEGHPARGGTRSVAFAQSTRAIGSSTVFSGYGGTASSGRGEGDAVVGGVDVPPGGCGGVAVVRATAVTPTATATTTAAATATALRRRVRSRRSARARRAVAAGAETAPRTAARSPTSARATS